MKTEELKQLYAAPTEGFHERVVQTLDRLETISAAPKHHVTARKVAIICAVAAALGVLSVTAVATNFFGLTTTQTGMYSYSVKMQNESSQLESLSRFKMVLPYIPEACKSGYCSDIEFYYSNQEEDYLHVYVMEDEELDSKIMNVVETSETEMDGHQVVIFTCKVAQNIDRLYYTVFKYFKEEGCALVFSASDYDELMKTVEQAVVKLKEVSEEPEEEEYGENIHALKDYREMGAGGGFMDEYTSGRVKNVEIGEAMELQVADYGKATAKVTAVITSLRKQDTAEGLLWEDFTRFSDIDLYSRYFNSDGTLKKEFSTTRVDGADGDHLGVATELTYTRHFYVAEIEVTADSDINNLYGAFGIGVEVYDKATKTYYKNGMTPDGEHCWVICRTNGNYNQTMNLKKGETATIRIGLIAENEMEDFAYLVVSAVDAQHNHYQNYMLKVKE